MPKRILKNYVFNFYTYLLTLHFRYKKWYLGQSSTRGLQPGVDVQLESKHATCFEPKHAREQGRTHTAHSPSRTPCTPSAAPPGADVPPWQVPPGPAGGGPALAQVRPPRRPPRRRRRRLAEAAAADPPHRPPRPAPRRRRLRPAGAVSRAGPRPGGLSVCGRCLRRPADRPRPAAGAGAGMDGSAARTCGRPAGFRPPLGRT